MKHLACIMDGNRRWAKKNFLQAVIGHKMGGDATQTVIDFCLEKSIPYLSLFAFSLENFNRSPDELKHLFSLFEDEGRRFLHENEQKQIAIRFVGDRTQFPPLLMPLIERIERETAGGSRLHLNILFCYGARQEMVSAVKKLLVQVQAGRIAPAEITEELLAKQLWLANAPEPDLIIRTGGAKRLSNFLLYQAAYTELYFLDCLWPDITTADLEGALQFFKESQRNFGK